MKEYEIHLYDWARIFAGQLPPAFYAEIVVRTLYLYILLLVSMRLLGKRMAAQFSRNDLAAMVSLAAAIGVPVVSADRGLLPSTIIAAVVVAITKLSTRQNFRNKKLEIITIGNVHSIVENGIFQIGNMHSTRLPRERVMAQLRSRQVLHLGQVKRLYMESTGDFSLVKSSEVSPGLLTLPAEDESFIDKMVRYTDVDLCLECGATQQFPPDRSSYHCPSCHSTTFTKAVEEKNDQ